MESSIKLQTKETTGHSKKKAHAFEASTLLTFGERRRRSFVANLQVIDLDPSLEGLFAAIRTSSSSDPELSDDSLAVGWKSPSSLDSGIGRFAFLRV
jgi:hypothetical protein